MTIGHARCYRCAKKKSSPTCSPHCKEIIRTSSLAFVTFYYIDLNDDDWCVSYNYQPSPGLEPSRVPKLISMRDVSQSLDNIALGEACDMLEEERSGLDLSLRGFDLGSTYQTAIEAVVVNTSEVEEEEDKLLSEIAAETRKLEKLELEVAASSAFQRFRD